MNSHPSIYKLEIFYISITTTSSIAYRSNQLNYLQLENAGREKFFHLSAKYNTTSASKSQLQILDKFNNETSNAYSLLHTHTHTRNTVWIFPFINVEREEKEKMKIILLSLSRSLPFFLKSANDHNSLIIFTRGWIPVSNCFFLFLFFFFSFVSWIVEILLFTIYPWTNTSYEAKIGVVADKVVRAQSNREISSNIAQLLSAGKQQPLCSRFSLPLSHWINKTWLFLPDWHPHPPVHHPPLKRFSKTFYSPPVLR